MNKPNTLYLLAEYGLHGTGTIGILESWMWILDPPDFGMMYISFHRAKSERAYKGGEILDIRNATPEEFEVHQKEVKERGKDLMDPDKPRKIIVFKPIPSWNKLWSQTANSHQMAYKALGYVEVRDSCRKCSA